MSTQQQKKKKTGNKKGVCQKEQMLEMHIKEGKLNLYN